MNKKVIVMFLLGIWVNGIFAQEWYIPKKTTVLEKGRYEIGNRIQLSANNDGLLDNLRLDAVFYFRFSPIQRFELYTDFPLSYVKKEEIENFLYIEKSGTGISDVFSQVTYEAFSGEDWKVMCNIDVGFPTGKDPYENEISFGSGHFSLALGKTAMKIIDPVILFAHLGYQYTFKREFNKQDINPGDSLRFRLGNVIALNPRLQTNFNVSGDLVSKTKIDDKPSTGSSYALVRFGWGLDWTISQKWRLGIDAVFGMTKNTPDATLISGVAVSF